MAQVIGLTATLQPADASVSIVAGIVLKVILFVVLLKAVAGCWPVGEEGGWWPSHFEWPERGSFNVTVTNPLRGRVGPPSLAAVSLD